MHRLTPQSTPGPSCRNSLGGSANGLVVSSDEVLQASLLTQENAVLARQLAQVQQRVTHQAVQQARRILALQAELMQQRAALIVRDTALLLLRQDMAALQDGFSRARGDSR